RESLLREIRVQLFQLADDEDRLAQGQQWLITLVTGDGSKSFILKQLEEFRVNVIAKLDLERSQGGRAVFKLYRTMVQYLNEDPERLASWENKLLSYVIKT